MFCKNCGNEVNDEAIVCTKCGCPISSYQAPKKEPVVQELPTEKVAKNFSFNVLSIIIALFVGLFSLLLPSVLKLIACFNTEYWGDGYSSLTNYIYTFNLSYVAFAFTMAVSITNLVFLFINTKKEKDKFTFILSLIINILTFALCLTMFLVAVL